MVNRLQKPVIIVGGGLVGLILAQALTRDNIPYQLYERDEALHSRYGGWGITLHWCIPALKTMVTPETFATIYALHNDPRTLNIESIPYRFFNLETGEAKTESFGGPHLRVSRLKLRETLTHGVNINWGVTVTGWDPSDDGVVVSLSNGKKVEGCFVACAEGKNSKIKRQLLGDAKSELYTFPLGFVGIKMRLSPEKIALFRNLSPIFFHGSHPNGKFIFFSTISTPEVNGSKGTENEFFEAQLNMSWTIGHENSVPPNLSRTERLQKIREAASEGTGFFRELREAFNNIPEDAEVLDIKLQDWITEPWPSSPYVTLLGDSVHPMTMYRGEAANHGVFDAYKLRLQLRHVQSGEKTIKQALNDYEEEMIDRAREGVILSRKAGFEVHDINVITEESALFYYPQVLSGNFLVPDEF